MTQEPDRRPVVTLVMALLCIPAAALAIFFWVHTPSAAASESGSLRSSESATALAAAKSEVRTIMSYDYRSIDADIAAAEADTTGVFSHQYAGTAHDLLSQARQLRAIVQATVGSAGVVSASPDAVVVLLFVDQASVRQTPGDKTPTTRIDQSRVRVTMTNVNGHWLVSALAAL